MLSILIPIYQQDVTKLVAALETQISSLDTLVEIICLDDGSRQEWKAINQELSQLKNTHYEELDTNVGRSVVRNKLADRANYPYLLFIDGDSKIVRSDFLESYLNLAQPRKVLIGGRIYPRDCPRNEVRLHWTYGTRREQNAKEGFQSNNFLIPATIFGKIRFSELVEGYGHEDTLFGYELDQQGIDIVYIDNPVLHVSLEITEVYLKYQIHAIKNLKRIRQEYPSLETRLTKMSKWIEQLALGKLFTSLYPRFSSWILHHLKGSNPRMWIFDLFKIGTWFTSS